MHKCDIKTNQFHVNAGTAAPPGGQRCQQSETAAQSWLDCCCCFEWRTDLDLDSLAPLADTAHFFLWEERHVWILQREDGQCALKNTNYTI